MAFLAWRTTRRATFLVANSQSIEDAFASLDTASALTSSFPSLAAFMAGIAHGDIGRRR